MKRWRYPCGCWFLLVVILTPKCETSPRWAAFWCKFSVPWSFRVKPRICLIWTQRPWFQWFFHDEFSPFCKKYFQKWNILSEVLYFRWRQFAKFFTIAYNMKGCLKLHTFYISNSAKFGKFYVWTITNWATSRSWKKNPLPDSVKKYLGII
jgi:hypothetical protein